MLGVSQRYRIFSFPWKSSWAIHSFKSLNLVFFFFPRSGKKKTHSVFFYFPVKVHTPFIQNWYHPPYFIKKFAVFFFSRFLSCFCVFFFSCKSSHVIHSFDFRSVFFFSVAGKKNTAFSFIQSILSKNV